MKIELLDVRVLPSIKRHEILLNSFRNLPEGMSFEFINDHDPKPLYYQFCAMFGNVVEWEYLKSEPEEWKIRVTKTDDTEEQDGMNTGIKIGQSIASKVITVVKQFDVRSHPCMDRHAMVFGTFDELKPGEAFIFTNDHDPKPLYFKLKAEYTEPFMWEYLQSLPGEWIIKVSKT